MYNIQLVFHEMPFDPYYRFDKELITGIFKKVNNKEITLPMIPTKEMAIDLSSFNSYFKFTKKEVEAIKDCNQIYEINNIIVTLSNIELWIS